MQIVPSNKWKIDLIKYISLQQICLKSLSTKTCAGGSTLIFQNSFNLVGKTIFSTTKSNIYRNKPKHFNQH